MKMIDLKNMKEQLVIKKKRLAIMALFGLLVSVPPTIMYGRLAIEDEETINKEAEDLIQPIRERQRTLVDGKSYAQLRGSLVVLKATESGFVGELMGDFEKDKKGMKIQFDKEGVAVSPNSAEYDLVRPLKFSRK